MAVSAESPVYVDPRILRTRLMLHEALTKLLAEKEFEKISIADIAEASTLNRATFYDHYADKFALLESMVASRFSDLIAKRNIRFDGCEGAVKKVAMGVCYYLTETPYAALGGNRQADTPLETAIVSVVKRLVLEGFKLHPPKPGVSPELLSSTISWAVYGAAKEWARTPKRQSVDDISSLIEKMVTPIFMSLE